MRDMVCSEMCTIVALITDRYLGNPNAAVTHDRSTTVG
jgi:hypothetical protein